MMLGKISSARMGSQMGCGRSSANAMLRREIRTGVIHTRRARVRPGEIPARVTLAESGTRVVHCARVAHRTGMVQASMARSDRTGRMPLREAAAIDRIVSKMRAANRTRRVPLRKATGVCSPETMCSDVTLCSHAAHGVPLAKTLHRSPMSHSTVSHSSAAHRGAAIMLAGRATVMLPRGTAVIMAGSGIMAAAERMAGSGVMPAAETVAGRRVMAPAIAAHVAAHVAAASEVSTPAPEVSASASAAKVSTTAAVSATTAAVSPAAAVTERHLGQTQRQRQPQCRAGKSISCQHIFAPFLC